MRLITDSDTDGYSQGEFSGIPIGTKVWIAPWEGSLVRNQWGTIIDVQVATMKPYELTYLVRLDHVLMAGALRGRNEIWLHPSSLMAGPFTGEYPAEGGE